MQNIIPSPIAAKNFIENATNSSNTFIGSLASSLLADMVAGRRQSNIDLTGKATDDIRYVLGTLNQMGYRAQITANKVLVIQW